MLLNINAFDLQFFIRKIVKNLQLYYIYLWFQSNNLSLVVTKVDLEVLCSISNKFHSSFFNGLI